ncbi:MAG: phosphatase PAP2 family protein [Oscillospiraceae bacterium]
MFIQRHMRSDALDSIMRFFTRLGNGGILWLLTAAVMWTMPRLRRCSVSIAVVLVVGVLTGNLIIKRLSSRSRPFDDYSSIRPLVKPPKDCSFPSCHSMSSFACATIICCFSVPLGAIALSIATIIAFSRLYLFVHYPSDVVVGVLWGIIIALSTNWYLSNFVFEIPMAF